MVCILFDSGTISLLLLVSFCFGSSCVDILCRICCFNVVFFTFHSNNWLLLFGFCSCCRVSVAATTDDVSKVVIITIHLLMIITLLTEGTHILMFMFTKDSHRQRKNNEQTNITNKHPDTTRKRSSSYAYMENQVTRMSITASLNGYKSLKCYFVSLSSYVFVLD